MLDAPWIAVLPCAGFGVRMGSMTEHTPKPLLEVAGRPILDYLVDQLAELEGLGVIHVVSNTRYRARFEEWAASRTGSTGERPRLEVHDDGVSEESDRLGLVGDLAFVLKGVGSVNGALVAAGDNILRFALRPYWNRFRASRRTSLIALRETDPDRLRRTGVLELGPEDRVTGFHEKPTNPPSTWSSPVLYFLDPCAVELARGLAPDRGERGAVHIVPRLLARMPVHAFRVEGQRLHVGTPAARAEADRVLRDEPVLLAP